MEQDLEKNLQLIKTLIDNAYDTTKNKYNEEWANNAIVECFQFYKANSFTRENNSRENIKSLLDRQNEIPQILLDYAISSFILNDMKCDITMSDLTAYVNDYEQKLDYSGTKAVKITAIAAAINTYWAYNLLAVNKKLKLELVFNFVVERYKQNKRNELDNSKKSKLIKLEGYEHPIMMSKFKLNNDVRNMNSDDEIEEYSPPTR